MNIERIRQELIGKAKFLEEKLHQATDPNDIEVIRSDYRQLLAEAEQYGLAHEIYIP